MLCAVRCVLCSVCCVLYAVCCVVLHANTDATLLLPLGKVPALSLWVLFEWAHFRCQLTLRAARGVRGGVGGGAGSGSFTERVSPMLDGSVLYSKIASPHYLLETCGWVAFTCATGGVRAAWAFTIIGFFTMLCWATQRYDHVKVRREGGKEGSAFSTT